MAEKYPNKIAYIFQTNNDLKITYSDLKRQTYLLAENFLKLGLHKGDRVALILPNTSELLITYFASALIGLINVPMDPNDTIDEYTYMIGKASPKALILYDSEDYAQIIATLFPETRDPNVIEFKSSRFSSIEHVFVVKQNGQVLTKDFNMKAVRWFDEISEKSLDKKNGVDFPIVECDDLFGIFLTVILKFTLWSGV
jgi:acyl-coenzyme A synthetase/AMP-(fatty) acid ligase